MPKIIDVSPESIPVEVQPSGLDLFDLSVKATPLTITWNKEALESAVNAVTEQYEGLVVTEDMIPAVKAEMAGLNKLKDKLNTARKEIVNSIKAPLDMFDREISAVIGTVTTTRAGLDEQVKEFERRDRDGRRTAIQFMIDAAKHKAGLADFDIPINERWLNKSAKTATTAAEIENLCLKESMHRTEVLQLERAKQDRVTLVGEAVKQATAQHGFDLPMGKFAPCLSLEISGDEAISLIAQAFAAEAGFRRCLREQTAEVAPAMPSATVAPASVEMPTVPSVTAAPDPWELPTVDSTPSFPSMESLNLTLSFAPKNRAAVLDLLERLRDYAAVTIN